MKTPICTVEGTPIDYVSTVSPLGNLVVSYVSGAGEKTLLSTLRGERMDALII